MKLKDSKNNPIVIKENIISEKIINSIDNRIVKLKSLLIDTYRAMYAIKNIKCSKKEKDLFDKITDKAKICIEYIVETLENPEKNISYETVYSEFLDLVSKFYDIENNTEEKSESIDITDISNITKYFESVLNQVKVKYKDANKKFINAIYIIVNRTMNVINKLQYNYSNEKNKPKKKDFSSGVANNRFGKNRISVDINSLSDNDIGKLLETLRTTTSYTEYKKLFDSICDLYGKEDVSAIKLLSFEKMNKVVFVTFGKMKPMTFKAGTPIYHTSNIANIKNLDPRFKSRDNITFYSTKRIYFADKLTDPKEIFSKYFSNEKLHVYRHILKKDVIAYKDSEYGSWYHNYIYMETDNPIPVEDITDELASSIEIKEEEDNA